MPKVLKNIQFDPYIRKGDYVSGYRRLMLVEVNMWTPGRGDIKQMCNEILGIIKEGDMKKAESKLKTLYRQGKRHFTDEFILYKENSLFNIYETMNGLAKKSTNSIPTKEPVDVFSKIASPDYVVGLIDSVTELQTFFRGLSFPTERINNFTFRFKTSVGFNKTPEEVAHKFNGKTMPRLKEVFNNIGGSISTISRHIEEINPNTFKIAFGAVRDKRIGKKKFNNVLGPALLLENFHISNIPTKDENIFIGPKKAKIIEVANKTEVQAVRSFVKSNFPDILNTPPDSIRESLKGVLRRGGEGEPIRKFIDKVEDAHLIPALNYIFKHNALPIFITTDEGKELMRVLKSASASIFNLIDPKKAKDENMVYVSRNPLDFLTMSHDGYLDSCQCLTKKGELNITLDNANVVQSYNLDKLDDFIMYTGNEKPKNSEYKKTARCSMYFNRRDKKFVNFEGYKVYGQVERDVQFLSEFIRTKMKNYVVSGLEELHQKSVVPMGQAIMGSIGSSVKELIKNDIVRKYDSVLKILKKNPNLPGKHTPKLREQLQLIEPMLSFHKDDKVLHQEVKNKFNQALQNNFYNPQYNSYNYQSPLHRVSVGITKDDDAINKLFLLTKKRIGDLSFEISKQKENMGLKYETNTTEQ